jgi:hypothetical protein
VFAYSYWGALPEGTQAIGVGTSLVSSVVPELSTGATLLFGLFTLLGFWIKQSKFDKGIVK